MKHYFARRTAITAAVLAVAAGTLLAVGGTASAAPGKATGRITVTAHHSSDRTEYGNHRDNNRGDHRRDDRDDRRDNRWDGHRRWERTGSGDWYCNDHGRQYRYDGHRFYERNHGEWRVVNTYSHNFDHRIFG
ncbi:hypothetical protein [Streptomyces sp. NPDC101234]|uniref:hypothetical protein n=1 Tax=Streptomyces sp. NPDC101234 TaxID=3366138 RepID=UPI00382DE4E0